MRTLLASALACLFLASHLAAAAPAPLDPGPLERGIAIAAPSVYRLDVTVDVAALEFDGGRLPLSPEAGRVTTLGTAFAIAEDGWLVAADHVVSGSGDAVAISAYQQHLLERGEPGSMETARDWVGENRARPAGITVVSRTISQDGVPEAWQPTVANRRPGTDLALLRIDAPGAPAVDLDEAVTLGTDVAVISYRTDDDTGSLTAVARRGSLGRTGTARSTTPPGARRTIVAAAVARGDSGAPVVDAEGRVRGMVVALNRGGGGTIEPAGRIRELLGGRATAGEGEVSEAWRVGLAALWALDFASAEASFDRVMSLAPSHPGAAAERERADRLAGAGIRFDGRDPLFRLMMALALIGVVGAVTASAGLVSTESRRRNRQTSPEPITPESKG